MSDWPNDWVWKVEGGAEEDDAPSTAESFQALDEAGRDPSRAVIVGPAVTCPLPYVSIVVHDAAGKPVVGASVKLAFPAGGGKTAKTDRTGRAHFGNVDAKLEELMVRTFEEPSKGDDPPTYRVEVVPLKDATSSPSEQPKEVREEPFLYVEIDTEDG
jgi:hypothetical protein